jgi:hypothetical protein
MIETDWITEAWRVREQEINEDSHNAHSAIDALADEGHAFNHAWMNVAAARLTERFPDLLPLMRRVEELGSDTPPRGFPAATSDALTQPVTFSGELGPPPEWAPTPDEVTDIIAALRPIGGEE